MRATSRRLLAAAALTAATLTLASTTHTTPPDTSWGAPATTPDTGWGTPGNNNTDAGTIESGGTGGTGTYSFDTGWG